MTTVEPIPLSELRIPSGMNNVKKYRTDEDYRIRIMKILGKLFFFVTQLWLWWKSLGLVHKKCNKVLKISKVF